MTQVLTLEMPCEECGGLVDLTSVITVQIVNVDGTQEEDRQMTEADARQLLAEAGIQPPPVMCDKHERFMVTTEKLR